MNLPPIQSPDDTVAQPATRQSNGKTADRFAALLVEAGLSDADPDGLVDTKPAPQHEHAKPTKEAATEPRSSLVRSVELPPGFTGPRPEASQTQDPIPVPSFAKKPIRQVAGTGELPSREGLAATLQTAKAANVEAGTGQKDGLQPTPIARDEPRAVSRAPANSILPQAVPSEPNPPLVPPQLPQPTGEEARTPSRAPETPPTLGLPAPTLSTKGDPATRPQPTEPARRAPLWPASTQQTPQPSQTLVAPQAGETSQAPLPPVAARAEGRGQTTAFTAGASSLAAEPSAPTLGSVNVTRRETHFAPVRAPAAIEAHVVQQHLGRDAAMLAKPETAQASFTAIADQLKAALDGQDGDGEQRFQQALNQQATAAQRTPAPLRLVEISLQPASLGALAVTLRLTSAGLKVTVSATNRETAELLNEDKDALANLVAQAGYRSDDIEVIHKPSRTA
ncbi:MAG: flagellar hook-length control protein FliK [Pseudomonadota bacterium]